MRFQAKLFEGNLFILALAAFLEISNSVKCGSIFLKGIL